MLRIVIFIVISGALLGCRGGVLRRQPDPPVPESQWFCEPAAASETWRCVQDDNLAKAPFPRRPPPDPAEPAPSDEPVAESSVEPPADPES